MHHRASSSRFSLLHALVLGAAASAAGGSLACSSSEGPTGDEVTIGLLLPFTGASSATASNFERAVIFAADRVNAGGGVHGRRVRIVSKDTHSDVTRSHESVAALIAAGAVVVIGPESSEIAAAIAPTLAANQVAFLSPLIGAANDRSVDCTTPWFRLAPSARALGEALAKLVRAEGVSSTAVLYATGEYNEALSAAVNNRFTALGGQVVLTQTLDPDAQSYGDAVAAVEAANVPSIVLATSPRTGALFINEIGVSGATVSPRWFLSPLLKTNLFTGNVAPDALDGALGVAPKIYDTTAPFPDAFAARWQGDRPLEGAYFYYDAMALLAFALQKTVPDESGRLPFVTLEASINQVAAPPGEELGWNDIATALQQIAAGDSIYYSGLTGPMLLDSCGARLLGVTTTWQVGAGVIGDR